jgi:hypothetical protein
MNNLTLLVTEALLAVAWAYCLYAVLNPKKVVKFTVERSLKSMKFYGFIASIKPTKRTQTILLKGHLFVLLLVTVYLVIIPLLFR